MAVGCVHSVSRVYVPDQSLAGPLDSIGVTLVHGTQWSTSVDTRSRVHVPEFCLPNVRMLFDNTASIFLTEIR